jgi:hypothetical protein
MGMDVYIDGELTVPAAKVPEAGNRLLAAAAEKVDAPDLDEEEIGGDVFKLAEALLNRLEVTKESNGDLTFGLEDSCRHEEDDQWIIEALAPVMEDGAFYMSADDYRWQWQIESGEFSEVSGEIIYDHDSKAVPTINKIIELMYPGGKPLQVEGSDAVSTLYEIENLLRETGYGPQAGMAELDRLAEV